MIPVPVTWATAIATACTWEDGRPYRKDLPPGSAAWASDYAALQCVCPCGCGSLHYLSIALAAKHAHTWIWNGDTALPTLQPSIQMTSPCRWHGFLTQGLFHEEGVA